MGQENGYDRKDWAVVREANDIELGRKDLIYGKIQKTFVNSVVAEFADFIEN